MPAGHTLLLGRRWKTEAEAVTQSSGFFLVHAAKTKGWLPASAAQTSCKYLYEHPMRQGFEMTGMLDAMSN